MPKASKQMRIWFAVFSILLWLGIYLTGFNIAHWLLYIPAIMLVLAAITGICPSQILLNKTFPSKDS